LVEVDVEDLGEVSLKDLEVNASVQIVVIGNLIN
jgi:hypothetical protein